MAELRAGAATIPWTLRRNRRSKHIRIVVRSGRVEVVAPPRAPRRTIDAFVEQKTGWIRAQVEAWREREVEALPPRFESGGRVLYRGRQMRLEVEPAPRRRARVEVDEEFRVEVPAALDAEAQEAAARTAVVHWLREKVRADANLLLDAWSPRIGVRPRGLRIGSQKTLWGSCSSRGVISLNWRLVTAPEEILEYVVVHEACHLVHANHSPRFWALVERHLPEWRERRAWLGDHHVRLG